MLRELPLVLYGFAISGVLLTLGYYVWPSWPIQDRSTRLVGAVARMVGIASLVLNVALLVAELFLRR